MAMHYWNGSTWAIVNNAPTDGLFDDDYGAWFRVWNGSEWIYATNAKVYNGSTWKGFVDRVQLSNDQAQTVNFSFGAECAWAIYSSGNVIFDDYGPSQTEYPWIVNPANSNQYEILVTKLSGDPLEGTSDPLDTWLDLATTRVWRVFADNQFNTTVFTTLGATIRHKITQAPVAVNEFSLYATTTGNPNFGS
jgi:hypothetical protein